MNNLKNKTAIITGATSGIGKSFAKNLVLTGRRKDKLKKLKNKLSRLYNIDTQILNFDVTNQNDVEKKLSKLLKTTNIDILINNAGLALCASIIIFPEFYGFG